MHTINITAVGYSLTESIKQYVENKIGHVFRHAPEALRIEVVLSKEGHSPTHYTARGHVVIWGPDMHVSTRNTDLYAGIDDLVIHLQRMVRRKHRKLKTKRRVANATE